jgi:HEAT repeat protein
MRPSFAGIVAVIGATLAAGCSRPSGTTAQAPARPAASAAPASQAATAVPAATVATPAAPVAAAPATAAQADPLPALRTAVSSAADVETRLQAIDKLGDLGQRASPALAELVAATAADDVRVRSHAARSIGLIGEDALSALPDLVKLLGDPDPVTVAQAAAAIALIRQDDGRQLLPSTDAAIYEATVEPLAQACVHADPRVRRAAARSLRVLHPDPRTLVTLLGNLLDDADPSVVLPALHTLADLEDHSLPVLQEALADPRSRYWAAVAISEVGPEAAAAVPAVTKLAVDGELNERLEAIMALASIGEPAAAATPALLTALESNEELLQYAAAFALGKLKAAAADEPLRKLQEGGDEFLGAIAAWARAEIRPDDAQVVDEALSRLRKGLASSEPTIRRGSVSGLSDIAENLPAAGRRELATQFAELLDDPSEEVGMHAGGALVRLGPDAIDELRKRLGEPAHRAQSLGVLAAIGKAAAPAVPDLVAVLAGSDEVAAGEAAEALAAVGPAAVTAVPALEKLLADATPAEVRYPVAFALGRIGPAAKPAVPRLLELSTSADEIMATVATWAVLKIQPEDATLVEQAIPLLRRALRGERDLARLEAAVSLGDIGPAARSAIPLLELVAEDDPVKAVRTAAAAALAKIKGS